MSDKAWVEAARNTCLGARIAALSAFIDAGNPRPEGESGEFNAWQRAASDAVNEAMRDWVEPT